MLFLESGAAEECPTMPAPMFLFGEKKQAICTSTYIRPEKKVLSANKDCSRVWLEDYLYVSCLLRGVVILTPSTSRSKYIVELGEGLDDVEVSLLIENGLKNRFPVACDTWKSQTSKSEETLRKQIAEKKKRVDEELDNDRPLLEDTLTREVARRIWEAYPYVSPFLIYIYSGILMSSKVA